MNKKLHPYEPPRMFLFRVSLAALLATSGDGTRSITIDEEVNVDASSRVKGHNVWDDAL